MSAHRYTPLRICIQPCLQLITVYTSSSHAFLRQSLRDSMHFCMPDSRCEHQRHSPSSARGREVKVVVMCRSVPMLAQSSGTRRMECLHPRKTQALCRPAMCKPQCPSSAALSHPVLMLLLQAPVTVLDSDQQFCRFSALLTSLKLQAL